MSKTYFCKLVSGFFLNLNQTTAVIIYKLSKSIIIKISGILSFGYL